jgi:putative transposase
MVTPAVKREAVAHLRQVHEMSERRACKVIGCVRMTVRYRSRRIDDVALRERLRALAKCVAGSAIAGSTFSCAAKDLS